MATIFILLLNFLMEREGVVVKSVPYTIAQSQGIPIETGTLVLADGAIQQ
jgi:hypothetical protein